jgi:hypothetical protein
MAGLLGMNVDKNRMNNPAAYHIVPNTDDVVSYQNGGGLQWSDMVTTTFRSWMGMTNTPFQEFGHRLIISVAGVGKPGPYECEIMGSRFWVSTNTSTGSEITYNSQFVGINYGPNNQQDSLPDSITGRLIQKGDDIVYDNGQLPSQVNVDFWYRFGATYAITCTSVSAMRQVQTDFARTNQTITAKLFRGGQTVGVYSVKAAVPRLRLTPHVSKPNMLTLELIGGQYSATYSLQWSPTLNPSKWEDFSEMTTAMDRKKEIPLLGWPSYFFRTYQH